MQSNAQVNIADCGDKNPSTIFLQRGSCNEYLLASCKCCTRDPQHACVVFSSDFCKAKKFKILIKNSICKIKQKKKKERAGGNPKWVTKTKPLQLHLRSHILNLHPLHAIRMSLHDAFVLRVSRWKPNFPLG